MPRGVRDAEGCPGRLPLGKIAYDVIATRLQVQAAAITAFAHEDLVAAAAAWNCGGCVCPSAAVESRR